MRGERFAQRSALSVTLCNNRMDSRCQNDKQMDCHNLIKMQGIQKDSHCCIVRGPSLELLPIQWNRLYWVI